MVSNISLPKCGIKPYICGKNLFRGACNTQVNAQQENAKRLNSDAEKNALLKINKKICTRTSKQLTILLCKTLNHIPFMVKKCNSLAIGNK